MKFIVFVKEFKVYWIENPEVIKLSELLNKKLEFPLVYLLFLFVLLLLTFSSLRQCLPSSHFYCEMIIKIKTFDFSDSAAARVKGRGGGDIHVTQMPEIPRPWSLSEYLWRLCSWLQTKQRIRFFFVFRTDLSRSSLSAWVGKTSCQISGLLARVGRVFHLSVCVQKTDLRSAASLHELLSIFCPREETVLYIHGLDLWNSRHADGNRRQCARENPSGRIYGSRQRFRGRKCSGDEMLRRRIQTIQTVGSGMETGGLWRHINI